MGLPDEDMEVYAEHYERHPFMPFDPGQCVCTGSISPTGLDLLQWDLGTKLERMVQGAQLATKELFG